MELNIRKIRLELKRLGWSSADLAREMKTQKQLVHRLLTGENTQPHMRTVERVAKALGVADITLIK